MNIIDTLKIELVFAVLVIWSLFYASPSVASAQEDFEKRFPCESYKEILAEAYWNIGYELPYLWERKKNEYVYARSNFRHIGCIKVKDSSLEHIGPHTRAAKNWMKIWINRSDYDRGFHIVGGEDGKSHEIGPKIIDRMQEVSGLRFKEQREWQRWWKENSDFLIWSNEKGVLVVDDQAKQNIGNHN